MKIHYDTDREVERLKRINCHQAKKLGMDFASGELVRNYYRGQWCGKIVSVGYWGNTTDPYIIVKVLCTADGRLFRKPFLKRRSPYWFKRILSLPIRYDAETVWGH